MSYYDDWIAPNMIDVGFLQAREAEAHSMCHVGWTTAADEFIPYGKMETSHLLNCKRMIERKNGWRRDFLPYIEHELRLRGHNV